MDLLLKQGALQIGLLVEHSFIFRYLEIRVRTQNPLITYSIMRQTQKTTGHLTYDTMR